MIASLPMYDRAETRGPNDRFWALVRDALRAEGGPAPETLGRSADPWADWVSPDLVLSQTCGMPYRTRLHGRVALVATPVHDLPCAPGCYFSVLVARAADPRRRLEAFDGARLAVNDRLSQSGWAAPLTLAAARGVVLSRTVVTGSHRASAEAVARGDADLAAIDAVTWRMIRRWDAVAEALREVATTPPTPALPFITARGRDTGPVAAALRAAIAGLDPADRHALCLRDVTVVESEAYLRVPTPTGPPAAAVPEGQSAD